MKKTSNPEIFLHVCDVSLPGDVNAFALAWAQNGGHPVQALINNAGVLLDRRATTSDGLDACFATNTLGTYAMTVCMLPYLAQAPGRGRAIAVSSGGMYTAKMNRDWQFKDLEPWDGVSAYAQTKRAQIYLTERWARQYGSAVWFGSMHPGWVDTPGVQTSLPGFYERMKDDLRDPYQGADTIVWMAASAAAVQQPPGQFYLDRQPTSPHLTLAFTHSSDADVDALLEECAKRTGLPLPTAAQLQPGSSVPVQ
jgi:dehydrogenase/reductase SDR family protein 12